MPGPIFRSTFAALTRLSFLLIKNNQKQGAKLRFSRSDVMMHKRESKWKSDDFNNADIYAAIRYLETDPRAITPDDDDRAVVIFTVMFILLVGLLCLMLVYW